MSKFTNAVEILALANDTRERIASEIFNYDLIKELITEKAAAGEISVTIHQDKPYDLEPTKYAQGLCEKLAAQGYVTSYVHDVVAVKIPTHIDPLKIQYKALKISWAGAKKKTGK